MPHSHIPDWIFPGELVHVRRGQQVRRREALIQAMEYRHDDTDANNGLYVRLEQDDVDPGWYPIAWVIRNCHPVPIDVSPIAPATSIGPIEQDQLILPTFERWVPSIGSRFVWGGIPGRPIGTITAFHPELQSVRFRLQNHALQNHAPELEANIEDFHGQVVSWITLAPHAWMIPGRVLALHSAPTTTGSHVIEELWSPAEGVEPLVRLRQLDTNETVILRASDVGATMVATEEIEPIDNLRSLEQAAQTTLERLPQAFETLQAGFMGINQALQTVGTTLAGFAVQAPPLAMNREPERRKTAYEHLLEEDADG